MTDSLSPHSPRYQGPVLTIWRDGRIERQNLPKKTLTWRKKFGGYVWLVQAVCNIGLRQNDRVYPVLVSTCFTYARRWAEAHHADVFDDDHAVALVRVTRIARSEAMHYNMVQGEDMVEEVQDSPAPQYPCWMSFRAATPAILPPKLPLDTKASA